MHKEHDAEADRDRATWVVVLGLLTAVAATGCTGYCPPESYPPGDPCEGKGGCDTVPVDPDAGEPPDGGTVEMRFCGCCNG
jgi:hypothetical protein